MAIIWTPQTRAQFMDAQLTAAVLEYPVTIRYMGVEIQASFASNPEFLQAEDGGIDSIVGASVLIPFSALVTPLVAPITGDVVEVFNKGAWDTYEVRTEAESRDPNQVGVLVTLGNPGTLQ